MYHYCEEKGHWITKKMDQWWESFQSPISETHIKEKSVLILYKESLGEKPGNRSWYQGENGEENCCFQRIVVDFEMRQYMIVSKDFVSNQKEVLEMANLSILTRMSNFRGRKNPGKKLRMKNLCISNQKIKKINSKAVKGYLVAYDGS